MTQMNKFVLGFIPACTMGAIIWLLSPYLTGELEPWDSGSFYYPIALIVSGLLLLFYKHSTKASIYWGIILGQIIYILIFLPKGPLMLVGSFLIFLYSLLALFGLGIKYILARNEKEREGQDA